MPHQIDHIIAQQHRDSHQESNLCLCCLRCNLKKGPNIASTDPEDRGGASIASSPSFILGSSGGRSTFNSEKTVA